MQIATKSYFTKYLNIYIWQSLAFVVRFLSMFLVMPYLTKVPSTYGIYAVCVSVTIFFNYADFGFMRSGQKFASECIKNNNRDEEMKYIGFTTFVLLIFTILIAIILLLFSFNPTILLKGVIDINQIRIASNLLLILAIFTPITVFQRMVSMIFEIRLESYLYQRISLFASLITIISVLYFFANNEYKIVQYFLFTQFISISSLFLCYKISKKRYNYNYQHLLSKMKFNREIYQKCYKLAYSGLFVMIAGVFLYELDNVIISKYIGVTEVAIYSIALSFSSIFRTFFGILFSPFAVRMNYFVANNEYESLKNFCLNIIVHTAPLVIFPTITFVLISHSFIFSWVGPQYLESINIARFIALTFTFSFISYTATMLLVAVEKVKEMYIVSTLQPFLFWISIYFFYPKYGLVTFGFFKFMIVIIAELFYFFILFQKVNLNLQTIFNKILKPLLIPLSVLFLILILFKSSFPYTKSKYNLLYISLVGMVALSISYLVLYFTSIDFKFSINKALKIK